MEVITLETQVVKEIVGKLDTIFDYIASLKTQRVDLENEWVDNYDVCTFLKISKRTLQRLRSDKLINYTIIRGRTYYKLAEIKHLMEVKLIKGDQATLEELVKNNQAYVKKRCNQKPKHHVF